MKALAAPFKPEAALLLLCARTRCGDRTNERIEALLRRDLHWPDVLRLAHRHGVAALLHRQLHTRFADLVPAPVLHELHRYCLHTALHNLSRTEELLRVVRLLETHQIPVIPFKGPLLGALVYDDPALRQFADLDVLVRRDDLFRTKELLTADGYTPYRQLSPEEEQAFLETQMGYELVKERCAVVEVHWALLNKVHAFALEPQRIWAHATTVTLSGQTIRSFSAEDLLLYLCAHGSKSLWTRLIWICDVAELVRSHPRLDWDFVLREARRLRSERMLFLGLYLAATLLETDLPAPVLRRLHTDASIKPIAEKVQTLLFREEQVTSLETAHFHLNMREQRKDRLPYYLHLLRIALTPNEKDRAFLRLPEATAFLYYLLRPIRVLTTSLSRR